MTALMRFRREPIIPRHSTNTRTLDGSLCLLEMKPNFILYSAVVTVVLVFMSQVLPVRSNLREICERPDGSCRRFCIKTETHIGRCLNNRRCCLPLGKQPRIESASKT
ncbi:beta-defensin 108B [Ochotona princeps]|uniref:beta-defensin 108B n=1 Tax=Ochotona princeps TaxID=9978 RepID=UPI0027154197|nr:beta-defensin 108B [Ochotona princeps]